MRQCKTCKWRDRCDLDCGDPQGFSYTPTEAEDERIERWEEEDNDND